VASDAVPILPPTALEQAHARIAGLETTQASAYQQLANMKEHFQRARDRCDDLTMRLRRLEGRLRHAAEGLQALASRSARGEL